MSTQPDTKPEDAMIEDEPIRKMNPEVKTQWLEALRSGRYKQGRDYLNQNGEFCCLGVLCELAVNAGVAEKKAFSEKGRVSYISVNARSGSLPEGVREWAGMRDSHGYVSIEELSLDQMNDSGYTFAEIADLIEEYL